MKLFCICLGTAAAGFLAAALLGHTAAWAPAALLGLAAAAGGKSCRKDTDKQ